MNINEFIKDLSMKDKKTLSQKGLKLVEEIGELARVILPYDSAHGTNHRFIDKEKLLEEVVDVYLTNISIAHSVGITEEEFNDMLNRKSLKWAELQSKEENVTFPLPFEIHITVDAGKTFNHTLFNGDEEDILYLDRFEIDHFKEACSIIEVKAIVLDLEINDEQPIKDVMTSSKHFGDNKSAYLECERISSELNLHGYKVLRKKIESVPWHPAAPTIETGEPIPNGCYFESHIGVVILPEQKNNLNIFVNSFLKDRHLIRLDGTAKLNQNFFKKSKDGSKFVNMLTYRCNMISRNNFEKQVEGIRKLLTKNGFDYEKVEIEYAVYDTNVNHDSKWITGK